MHDDFVPLTALLRPPRDEPVSVRVAPADVAATECGLPVVGDASLGPGDVVLAVRDGVLDARFHLRVQRALRAVPE